MINTVFIPTISFRYFCYLSSLRCLSIYRCLYRIGHISSDVLRDCWPSNTVLHCSGSSAISTGRGKCWPFTTKSLMRFIRSTGDLFQAYMENSNHTNHPTNFCELPKPILAALLRNLNKHSSIAALWLYLDTIEHGTTRSLKITVLTTLKAPSLSTNTRQGRTFGTDKCTKVALDTASKVYFFRIPPYKNWWCSPYCKPY